MSVTFPLPAWFSRYRASLRLAAGALSRRGRMAGSVFFAGGAALLPPGPLAAQVTQKPAITVSDGDTLKPGPGLAIPVAAEIDLGTLLLRPHALPAGLSLAAEFGLIVNSPMLVSRLFYQAGVRADCARVVKTPAGDYLAVIAAGSGHYAPRGGAFLEKRNDLVALRSSDRGKTWRGPSVLFPVPYSMHGFVPLIPRGGKRIYGFGTEPIPAEREDRENAPIAFRFSDDDGHTWSAPTVIRPANDPGFKAMAVMQMTETASGAWLIGAHEARWDPGSEDYARWVHQRIGMLHTRQYLLRSEDRGKTWMVLPGARPNGWFVPEFDRMDEARPLALDAGRVLTLIRTAQGHLWATWSADDGKTWTAPAATPIVQPDAPPMLFKLADGKTLVVFHHNTYDAAIPHAPNATRNQLWSTLSRDEGYTWSEPRFVMATAGSSRTAQIPYVDLLAEAGELHLFVTYAWKQTLQVDFTESALRRFPTRAELLRWVAR